MCTRMQNDHTRTLRFCSLCQSSVDYRNYKITQHALEVSVFIMLKLDTIRKKKTNLMMAA